MTYYGNMTDEERVTRIQHECARARSRWARSRESMTDAVEKEYLAQSRLLDEIIYADADLKVWQSIETYLDGFGEDSEAESPDTKIDRVRKHVRRAVQGYRGSHSSSSITNLINDVEHLTWIEALEMLDPSW